jgi:hypothetical protein
MNMGKPKKQSQPTDEQSPGKNHDREPNASQKEPRAPSPNEQHAGNAPLTLADMAKLLNSMEERIIANCLSNFPLTEQL